jgi:integrase
VGHALRRWATQGHESLRSLTRSDVIAELPHDAVRRKLYGQALRSIFAILKNRKLVFVNPAVRLNHTTSDWPISRSTLDLGALRAAFNSPDPARAALVALVAFHGLRSHQLRNIRLADVRDRHLHLDRRTILLPEPVRRRLGTWLDHRAQRWPATTNPHLFINRDSARHDGPVGNRWVFLTVGLPGGVQALRSDRILHEAAATGGDARRLCDLFGLSIQQATRYTDAITEPALPH